MWRDDYEDEQFEQTIDGLWKQVEPLYDELHKYVRRRLQDIYGQRLDDGKLIPAHLLGNMWAQSWVNLYENVKPFENASNIDVTEALKEQKYDALRFFETSNDFYMGLGLANNSVSYDVSRGAIIEKPKDRVITCHGNARFAIIDYP
jgi:peptidyl-dipeptidase A